MKKLLSGLLTICVIGVLGCAEPGGNDTSATDGDSAGSTSTHVDTSADDTSTSEPSSSESSDDDLTNATSLSTDAANMAEVSGGVAALTPENTSIRFVGLHTDPDNPDPRTGGFERFVGKAEVDPDANELKSVTIDIDTTSLWTQIDRLTNHLKQPDFFSVDDYPTAKFESTSIETAGDGKATITGELTLLETTEEISFPATVQISESGLALNSEFEIDRTRFGMNYNPERVEKTVTLMIHVGQSTEVLPAQTQGGGRGGRGGGRPDPTAMIKDNDADGDGKLTGDEIPERMQERMDRIDADGDGSITLEELQQGFGGGGGRRGGGGRGGAGGGGGDRPDGRPQRPDSE